MSHPVEVAWLFRGFHWRWLTQKRSADRYVFNYRASDAEETAAVVNYLVKEFGGALLAS
jgi:DNA-directed RNA polymerase specialized sigma24 family protein